MFRGRRAGIKTINILVMFQNLKWWRIPALLRSPIACKAIALLNELIPQTLPELCINAVLKLLRNYIQYLMHERHRETTESESTSGMWICIE